MFFVFGVETRPLPKVAAWYLTGRPAHWKRPEHLHLSWAAMMWCHYCLLCWLVLELQKGS